MMANLISVWLLITFVVAQAPQDPVRDFCRIYGHQTAVIDRKIYIDGGWQYANPLAQNPIPTINHGLLYGDLDTSNEFNFPQIYANLSKNNSVPDVSGGIIWADQVNKVLWLYGGEYSSAPGIFQLWAYDVILNQWNLSSAASAASSQVQRVAYGAGTTVDDLGKGYYYRGYLNKLTNPLWTGAPYATNSLVVFDMDHNTLTNKTGPPDGFGRAEGVMVSLPISASGALLYFGGVTYPYQNTTEVAQPMDSILLYDIADEKWVTQKATGEIPPNRRHFCAGATWARDKSSYNVYIYGGFGFGENRTGFDDVYILTMPAFRWIKWFPEKPGASRPHGLLSCNVISGSQMLIMGGNFTQDLDCDAVTTFGMHNLNLGQNTPTGAKWYKFLPNITSYNVPPAVIDIVGGSPGGGATKLAPDSWSDPAIQVYFNDKPHYQARTPTRYIPGATGKPTPGGTPSKHLGAIVGGAVGGFFFIIAIVLAFCWHRRRSNRNPRNGDLSSGATSVRPELSGVRQELSGTSLYDQKNSAVSHVTHSPASPQSPIPPVLSPMYTQQPMYSSHDPAYQHYYPPHPAGYPHYYADNTSPPEGWTIHPGQMQLHQQYLMQQQQQQQQYQYQQPQYFPPPPDIQRVSPPLHEMPTVRTPIPYLPQSPVATYGDAERTMHYPTPVRDSRPGDGMTAVKRREVGGASSTSPTMTSATHTSDAGSRL